MTRDPSRLRSNLTRALAVACAGVGALLGVAVATPAGASELPATSPSWCGIHGSAFVAWAGTSPEMPICGPGPDYGGTWSDVSLPGPTGTVDGYLNATPGFQCVEFAERFLAVADGFAPLHANGSEVAMNYHAAYPDSRLFVNGSAAAMGFPPEPGDVISFSTVPDFIDPTDGHVAVVISSNVDPAGDGSIVVAQQNVSPADYHYVLAVSDWRVSDPASPGDAEFQYPYAEWLVPHPYRPRPSAALIALLTGPRAKAHNPLVTTDALLGVRHTTARVAAARVAVAPRWLAVSRANRGVPLGLRSVRAPVSRPLFESPAPAGLVAGVGVLGGVAALRRRRARARRLARAALAN